jgi:CSLREA domain-containing protein
MTRRPFVLVTLSLIFSIIVFSLTSPSNVRAATVVTTFAVGSSPIGVAANPSTNRVYVTSGSNSVTVINSVTNAVITTIPVAIAGPDAIAVNATTNRIYVTSSSSTTIAVIDGSTNTLLSPISLSAVSYGIAVNASTNRIYVSHQSTNTVSVIDGSTNTLLTAINVGLTPAGIDVNPSTNRIYVVNSGSNTVSVIDGSNNTVLTTVNVGVSPFRVGVNLQSNRVYVTNISDKSVTVINTLTNAVLTTINIGSEATDIGVNATINRIYVGGFDTNSVSIINGFTNTRLGTVAVGSGPRGIGVIPSANQVYVANTFTNNVSVLNDTPISDIELVVNTTDDTDDSECVTTCSLREAIALIPNGGLITFAPSVTGTILLDSSLGELIIAKATHIHGPGAGLLTISGGNGLRIFNISSLIGFNIRDVTLVNGTSTGAGGAINNAGISTVIQVNLSSNQAMQGAAINNTGNIWVSESIFYGNTATTHGGAIYNAGTATLSNVTFYGNNATAVGATGGAIYNASGPLTISNSTIVNNTATSGGGAARALGSMKLQNTIIANNTGGNCIGTTGSGASNIQFGDNTCYPSIVQKDPKLGPLALNGGSTQTMAPLSGSPAIDTGNNTTCTPKDQRGNTRPIDGDGNGTATCDVGAYEASLGRPIAPTLLSPSGTIFTNTPLFRWNPVSGATLYMVWVSSPAGTIFQNTYDSATVCAASPCSLSSPVTMWNNNYTWWVKAYNAAGWGVWSNVRTFTISTALPAAPVLRNPTGTITTSTPAFSWTPRTGVTNYVLWISNATGTVFFQQYNTSVCTATLCTVPNPIKLWNGPFIFQMQSYNPNGYGPWSAAQAFTVNEAAPPASVLISPTGTITTPNPTFTWNTAVRATAYTLIVTGPQGMIIQNQYNAINVCSGSVCSVSVPQIDLTNGNYTWRIQTYGVGGYGPLSANKAFTVNLAPPGEAYPITPNGTETISTPTYTWNEAPGATYYILWVDSSTSNVISVVVDAAAYCDSGLCSFTPSTSLANGRYTWQIQPQGPGGYGPWSSASIFFVDVVGGAPKPFGSSPVPTFVPR